jgi:hypothetical protein
MQQEQHTLDGRSIDVKAAMPKSRGGSKDKGLKMFVGGIPVSLCNLLCVLNRAAANQMCMHCNSNRTTEPTICGALQSLLLQT